jgi:hypothetical protein
VQSWRQGDAKRFGGLEVDDKFEFGDLLHGQVLRLVTVQHTTDMVAHLLAPTIGYRRWRKRCPIGARKS